jgi:hypothetical protein
MRPLTDRSNRRADTNTIEPELLYSAEAGQEIAPNGWKGEGTAADLTFRARWDNLRGGGQCAGRACRTSCVECDQLAVA